MNQQMIGKSWLEWENDLPNDSDSAEEEFLEYRQTVKKETPQLTIDHDIKSEVCPEISGRHCLWCIIFNFSVVVAMSKLN